MPEATLRRKRKALSAPAVCLAACGLTLLLLAAVYALRGVWPFGRDNVAYVDTTQFYLPDFYKLWDAMHGGPKNVSWYAGLAESGSADIWSLTEPANLVLLLVPRDHILEGLSLYLGVCMALIALGAAIALCVRFPDLHPAWRVVLSVSYAFSGYVLQYYSNFSWLWLAAVFPLLLLSLERLLREGRWGMYTLLYAYFLFYSVYFAYMATIYVVLFSCGYCLFLLPREQRGDRLLRLGLCTAAAFALTAFWWMGSSSYLAGSSRFQSNLDSGLITGLTTWDLTNTRHTVLMLLGAAPCAALMLRALARRDGRRRGAIRFFLWMGGVFLLPMVFTNIDTAWHFGQYNFFPMRYGYMLSATLIAGAALCLEAEERPAAEDGPRPKPLPRLLAILPVLAGIILLEPGLSALFREYGAVFLNVLNGKEYALYLARLVACGLLFTALYALLFSLRDRRARPWIALLMLCQLGLNACGLIAPSDDHIYTREYDPAYVDMADELYAYLGGADISPLTRAKNVDNSLNAGYPALAGVSALSSVNANNSPTRLGVFRELGYTVNYFRILDTGGTAFSDMLLGVDLILSQNPLDGTLYADTGDTAGSLRIGRAVYPGTVGLTYRAGSLDGYLDILDLPGRLNALYAAFTDGGGTLAYTPDTALEARGEGVYTYTLTCDLTERALLYMSAEDAVLMNINAAGTPVPVPTYRSPENTVYPAAFNANLLYLGDFGPGTAEITFMSAAQLPAEALTVVALDQALLERFPADARRDPDTRISCEGASLTLELAAEDGDDCLFLPLTWSARWRCTVNGETVQPEPVLGVLTSVPLQAGENTVVLTRGRAPFSVTPGLIVTLLSLAAAAVFLALRRLRPGLRLPEAGDRLRTAARVLFAAVSGAVLLLVYLTPVLLFLARGTVIRF